MLKIFTLILAWIALTSCDKPDTEKVCGYSVDPHVYVNCLTEPQKRVDGLFECVDSESKLVAFGNGIEINEACW